MFQDEKSREDSVLPRITIEYNEEKNCVDAPMKIHTFIAGKI